MRATRLALLVACVLAAAGCGGKGGGGGGLDATLAYFPPHPLAVAVLSTDLESDQWKEVDRLVVRRSGRHVEDFFRTEVENVGNVSWDDVKAELGRELVVGVVSRGAGQFDFVTAFHARNGGKLRKLLDKARFFTRSGKEDGATIYRVGDSDNAVAVKGDVLVGATTRDGLSRALARAQGDVHLTASTFAGALSDVPADALLRVYGDPTEALLLRPGLPNFGSIPWIGALRAFGAGARFQRHKLGLDLVLRTDPSALSDSDLPFAAGGTPPGVLQRSGVVVSANRNQSLTTAFLFRVAEVAFPSSRFVLEAHRLQQKTGIDFVSEVLRQFDGPSASMVSLDGRTFAARSIVSDPARLERELRTIGPFLPQLVVALQGLQSEGEALLFLFAPDAPITFQKGGVRVTPPQAKGRLWRVTGLTGEGPNQLWFGVVGRIFVVGSTEALARRVATEPTVPVEGARGAAVLSAEGADLQQEIARRVGVDIGPVGEVVAWVETSRARLHARVTVDLP